MPKEDIARRFFDWVRGGSTGCLFARVLSVQVDKAKWAQTIVSEIVPELDVILDGYLKNSLAQGDEIHQFFFPGVVDADGVVKLINALCTPNRQWLCTEVPLAGPSDLMVLALRWQPPDKKLINWIVGFANLPTMPPTRRAPSTSIVIRTGLPSDTPGIALGIIDNGKPNEKEIEQRKDAFFPHQTPVHVADVPHLLTTRDRIVALWKGSRKQKAIQLGTYTPQDAAKAKSTFVLSATYRTVLKDALNRAPEKGI